MFVSAYAYAHVHLPAGRHVLHGHSGTVQDLSWRPGSETELVSCATDESIIMWDLRASKGPAGRVSRAHAYRSSDARTTELTAVEWQGHGGHLIASGEGEIAGSEDD